MNHYLVCVDVVDDPAAYSYELLVAATSEKSAIRLARKAAIEEYNRLAGGWSLKPQAQLTSIEPADPPPAPGVIRIDSVGHAFGGW